jgi:hypothetical protein
LEGPSAVSFFNRAKYAGYVEFDTRPHLILPRFKKVLRWRKALRTRSGSVARGPVSASRATTATNSGQFNFALAVNHPGTKGQHVWKRSLTARAQDLLSELGRRLDQALSRG